MNPDDSDDTITPVDDTDTDVSVPTDADIDTPDPATSQDPVAPVSVPEETASSSPDENMSASTPVSVSVAPDAIPPVSALPSSQVSEPSSPAPLALPGQATSIRSMIALAIAARHARTLARETKLMAFAQKKGSVTREDARLLLEISSATASRYLRALVKQGKLVMTGPKSETVYRVTDNLP